jgi:hypothetical protein
VVEHDQTSAILEDGRVVAGNNFFLGDFKTGQFCLGGTRYDAT